MTVRAGTVEREVTLDAEHDFLARVELPFAARVVVAADADVRLRVDLQTGRTERASDHEGWAAPLRVERALLRRDADGELVGLDDGPPRVGDRLATRVRVTTPVRVRYAVVGCALPAGL